MARPTVFNEKVCAKILEALKMGYNEEQACGYAGIGYSTFRQWRAEAQDHKTNTPKKCFFMEVDAAKSHGDYQLTNPIIDAIVKEKDVKVALRYAELRLKAKLMREAQEEKYADAQEIEITDDDVEWINNVSNYNSGTDADTSQ